MTDRQRAPRRILVGAFVVALAVLDVVLYQGLRRRLVDAGGVLLLQVVGSAIAAALGGLLVWWLTRREGQQERSASAGIVSRSSADRSDWRPAGLGEAADEAHVVTDLTGAIVEWSAQAERLFGWSRGDVVGRQLLLIPPEYQGDDQSGVEKFLDTARSLEQARKVELRAQHRDGYLVPVEATIWRSQGRSGRAPTINSRIRELKPQMPEEESCRIGSLVESAEDAMIGVGLDGTIMTWNRGAEQLYGYSAQEALGRPMSILFPEVRRGEAARLLVAARAGKTSSQPETIALYRDGSTIDVAEIVGPTYDGAGELTGASLIARDVSEQRRTAAELAAALEEARESDARSRRFLADAAHQLRTPIAGIRTCAETLLRGASPTERDRLLAGVVGETARAGRLMASLLQMARLDRGQPLVLSPCDVLALCEDEAARARRLAPHLAISVIVTATTEDKPELDGNAVAEILGNLLDNARRHARSRIDLVVAFDDRAVEVRVSDDGPGLTESNRERAFERFASLDGKGGSGLGLPIARGLARAHGGDLAYDERSFVLRLPTGPQEMP